MVFNITADNILVYNLTTRCKALTHGAKHPINGEVECNILSKFFAKTCSLNCIHNFDHPIKKRVEFSLFFLPQQQQKPVTCTYSTENEMLVNIYRKYKCIYPNEVGMNLASLHISFLVLWYF